MNIVLLCMFYEYFLYFIQTEQFSIASFLILSTFKRFINCMMYQPILIWFIFGVKKKHTQHKQTNKTKRKLERSSDIAKCDRILIIPIK